MKNSYKLLFFLSMMIGSLIAISSISWFSVWMGLEINLLSFIPLMMSPKNLFSSESSLKYFLTQTLASAIFLFAIIFFFFLSNFKINLLTFMPMLISSTMLLKSGAAPFHFWLPSVMEGLSWNTNMILMTWQKMAPLMIISYCLNFKLLIFIIFLSIFFGSIGGLNQTSLRKLMAFSSINHLGWMMSGMLNSEILWMTYFLFYCFLSLSIIFLFNNFKLLNISQSFSKFNSIFFMKIFMFLSLLSLGGLPPFLGFFPKWLIIELLVSMELFSILLFMLFFTLLTLYFYLRISYAAMMINHLEMNWSFKIYYQMKNQKTLFIFSFFSLFGLLFINMIFYFF